MKKKKNICPHCNIKQNSIEGHNIEIIIESATIETIQESNAVDTNVVINTTTTSDNNLLYIIKVYYVGAASVIIGYILIILSFHKYKNNLLIYFGVSFLELGLLLILYACLYKHYIN